MFPRIVLGVCLTGLGLILLAAILTVAGYPQ